MIWPVLTGWFPCGCLESRPSMPEGTEDRDCGAMGVVGTGD